MPDTTVADLLDPAGGVCEIAADLASLTDALRLAPGLIVPLVEDLASMRLVAELGADALSGARRALGGNVRELRASDLARGAVTCELSDTPEAALAIMRARRRSVLHVVDRNGRLCGSISIERAYLHSDPVARQENAPGSLRTAITATLPRFAAHAARAAW